MNMFVIGIPLKMIILFSLLIIMIGAFTTYSDIIIDNIVDITNAFIQGMMPGVKRSTYGLGPA